MDYYGLLFLYYLKGLSGKSILRLFFNIEAGGTEQLLPENTSTPTTTPILADIQYPDELRTDQYFTYRETPTTVSNKARIKTIKGNTLVWNQLVQNGNFENTSLWGAIRGSISASNNVLSYTFTELGGGYLQNRMVQTLPTYANRKYFVSVSVKAEKPTALMADVAGEFWLREEPMTPNVWNVFQAIRTGASDKPNLVFGCPSNIGDMAIGDVVQFKNVMLIDLTQMFGAGNEPTTVEEFTSLFPLPYYAYNQGSLLSFNGTGLKTTGKNLLNISTISEGQLSVSNGTFYPNTSWRASDFIPIINGTYTLGWKSDSTYFQAGFCLYDSNKTFIKGQSITRSDYLFNSFTVDGNASFVRVTWSVVISGTPAPRNDVQLEFGNQPTSYEPYTSSTLSLPISTYFPTGMKSAGNVYDELTESKAITRIWGYKITGQETVYSWGSGYGSHYGGSINVPLPDVLIGADVKGVASDGYVVAFANNDKTIYTNGNGRFAIINDAYTTQEAWLSGIKDVEVYFVLATPTETPITTEDANEALSLLMGKSVSSNNANQLINIITKGE